MPKDSDLAKFGQILQDCADTFGRPMTMVDDMRSRVEAAGFTNVNERRFKLPVGP